MAEHWITVKEAAACCDCKENTIVQQVVRDQLEYKYVPGKGKNGQQLRILVESLSPEAQSRYIERRRKPAPRTAEEMMIAKADKVNNIASNGTIETVDKVSIKPVPSEYLPENVNFMITHPSATLGPVKLAEYKTHENPPGVSGWLCEGRVYYDAFVLNNKKNAIIVSKKPTT